MKRGKSILQPDITRSTRKCYITERTDNIELHHIYPGKNRKTSDEQGFWVCLTAEMHRKVHDNPNKDLDLFIKRLCQRKYEETHTREGFLKLIGKSYLAGDDDA